MKATVLELDFQYKFQGKNGEKDCVKLVVQGDPYKDKPRDPRTMYLFIPYADDLIEKLRDDGVQVGDRVEYTVDDSQYKNLTDIWKIDGGNTSGNSGKQGTASSQSSPPPPYNATKDLAIARAVAIKASTELICSMMSSGTGKAIKKTMETELIGDEVLKLAKQFEPYLMDSEDTPKEDTPLTGAEEDFDQDDVPF